MSDTASPPASPRSDSARTEPPRSESPPAIRAPEAPQIAIRADSAPRPAEPAELPQPPAEATAPPAESPAPAAAPPAPPSPAAPAVPAASRSVTRLRRLLTVGGTILILFVLWEILTYYIAYTDDAYVRSDLVAIAPEVTGPIIGLYVVDNQAIKRGDKLYKIDPVPFQLEVNQRQAQIEEQTAQLKAAREELAASKAALEAATSAHTYAVEQQARYAVLAAEQSAPRAELDQWNNELRRSAAEMTISQLAIAKSQSSISAHQAALELAKADKAYAEWKLSRTDVNSPTDGWINNLTVRIGDTATVNLPNIGIVDAHAWRVIANYKEYYIRPLNIGDTAWVWLDSEPWKFHRARITGIARGFSRNPQAPMLLPYVAPTTDWIRLERRIPVTIVFEELPADGKLYMGADARVIIFPR